MGEAAAKTVIVYEGEKREMSMEHIYICSIVKDEKSGSFWVQSADVSKVEPHTFIRKDHPDIFRNTYVVLQGFEKDQGIEGYPLECGNFLKLARA